MTDPIPSGRAAKAGPAAVDISAPFDITAPLPRGTTVLEASAGTGKTWAIAALVARHVADGLPLDQLLVVTFGRAATEELRERVRERLIRAERLLRDALTGQARCRAGTGASGTHSVPSTTPPSPPFTSSAIRCCTVSGSPATPTPTRR